MGGEGRTQAFLTVEEAARERGLSRFRVREAVARGLLAGRRDNEGRLRVDLPEKLRLAQGGTVELEPDAILSFLFDDIEELESTLAERDTQIARLPDLVDRYDTVRDCADAMLAATEAQKARLANLLDRAMTLLEQEAATRARLEEREATLAVWEKALEATIDLSERAATLAEGRDRPRRTGFWRRLFGI